jgi:hypothetical protein
VSKSLARAGVIDGDLHPTFYSTIRGGLRTDAQIVRMVDLLLILPVAGAIRPMPMIADVLGLDAAPKVALVGGAQLRRLHY